MKLKPFAAAAALTAALCVMLCGCGLSAAGSAEIEEKVTQVTVLKAKAETIVNILPYPAQTKAAEQIPVVSKISGIVDEVFFDTGDRVRTGDILFTIETTDIVNNIKLLEAQVSSADAAIRSAQTGVSLAGGGGGQYATQTELMIEQRELALEQTRAAYDNVLKSYEDCKLLYDMGDLSARELEQFETTLQNAEIAVMQAESALEQARGTHGDGLRRAQDALVLAMAQKESLIVNLETAREKLEDAKVKSPIDGVVSSRNVEPKTMLTQTAAPFSVVSADVIEVKANVTESIVNKLFAGDTVTVYISAAADDAFEGTISSVSPAANAVTSAFEVKITVDNKDNIIKPGMYAEVWFIKETSRGGVTVPRSAVLTENGVSVVYTAADGRAVRNEVETGVDTGLVIEIVSGIKEGDFVIVKGQNYVKDGSPIEAVESGEAN